MGANFSVQIARHTYPPRTPSDQLEDPHLLLETKKYG